MKKSKASRVEQKLLTMIDELKKSDDPINLWFELSYAQFLTVPRLVMQSMPIKWQRKMAVLLEEMDETFDWRPTEGRYWVKLKDSRGRFVDAPLNDYRRGSCEHLRRKKLHKGKAPNDPRTIS